MAGHSNYQKNQTKNNNFPHLIIFQNLLGNVKEFSSVRMKWKFTPNDKEWHQTILHVFENLLDMKVKPIIVYDRNHFAKYVYSGGRHPNSVWAECIKECGIIWLNPHLATEPKVEIMNTLYHECLHIKYPKISETKVKKLADKMIPVTPSMTTKKRKFDITHRK